MLELDTELKTEDAEDRLEFLEGLLQEKTIDETLEEANFTKRYSFVLGVIVGEKLARERQLKAQEKKMQDLARKREELE
jgi:hypothetical protein